jgi:hypothetical protein
VIRPEVATETVTVVAAAGLVAMKVAARAARGPDG